MIEKFELDRSRVKVIPTPVSFSYDLPSKTEAIKFLQNSLALNEKTRFIGQISVLRSWKGHAFLIEAFSLIAENFPNYHLIIVGEGPMRDGIISLITGSKFCNRIHLLGYKPMPWEYFKAIDVAVLASTENEGIPQTLLQAMSLKTAVVATNVGGVPEIIFHEKTGLLVQPRDPQSIN